MEFLSIAHSILQIVVFYMVTLALTRFVFLEVGISGRGAKFYYLITAVVLVLLGVKTNAVFWMIIAAFFVAISIISGREKNTFQFLYALMILPIIGIAQGLMTPIFVFPTVFYAYEPYTAMIYQLEVYCFLLIAFCIMLLFFHEKIRAWISETRNRKLKKWERVLLSIIGIIMLSYSQFINQKVSNRVGLSTRDYKSMLMIMTSSSFALTVTVIILIMVGNRQNFYHKQIAKMQFNIIVMMAEIVENRDKNTGGHIKRTAKYVEIIAKQLKRNGEFKEILTDSYIEDMKVAAPLHDIGKIHVSDIILNKPGRLSEEEFEEMKTHANEGRSLLKNAKMYLGDFRYLEVATEMAGAHHEWWNGGAKGYPDHISGEEIPVCARIMAVADVFDALTSKRCYKDPMPLKKAFSIIRSERGTHFDPVVVDAFFNARYEIEAAMKKFYKDHEEEYYKLVDVE